MHVFLFGQKSNWGPDAIYCSGQSFNITRSRSSSGHLLGSRIFISGLCRMHGSGIMDGKSAPIAGRIQRLPHLTDIDQVREVIRWIHQSKAKAIFAINEHTYPLELGQKDR